MAAQDPASQLLSALRACRWVDLTHAFRPGIPHYSAFPDEEREVVVDYPDGFRTHVYRHVGQWGTHVDPPSHFVPGGRTVDEIGLQEMVLPLVVLDVRAQAAKDPDHAVSVADVEAWEAEHGRVPEGAFVAFTSGWADRWPDADAMAGTDDDGKPHHPGWSVQALELLTGHRDITAIGHDVTDTDPGALVGRGEIPAELFILQADRWQIELMAGLDQVPPSGALIVATWPKPEGGSGFPARCFALVPG